ncbi:Rho termination factor N-terminal domain-containing protein [Micromonospora sp. NBC_01699]|uniref:Rho termination factor N-terminal domain-containing protein n=1 Tax=Micromonospora sp. NBC_01699 TaxID=2975984 RepID=UPI002E294FFB|nr:Rho termination factor N-terminal domain-containing protein [Micromonospora sp. NBC_01699]
MTSPADLTHDVLLRVAEFIRTLPADQLADLAAGRAQLQLTGQPTATATVRTAPVRAPRGRAAAAAKPITATGSVAPVSAEKVRADLISIGDRAAATRYLDDLGLKVPELRTLARELNIAIPSRVNKPDVVAAIVQWTVGRRLDSAAISRPAPARD